MIDPTVWDSIILKITAEQYHFLNRELEITKTILKIPSLQDVSELIDSLFGDRFCKQPDKIERKVSPLCALVLIIEFIKGDTGEVINQFTYIL